MKGFSDYKIDITGVSGTQVRVLCPECSQDRKKKKVKDLAVNIPEKTWYCHHCGWKGGINGKSYKLPEYTAQTKLPEKVVKYFNERGITEQTLNSNHIGYGPIWMPSENKEANTIQFPYYKHGKIVNIKYRDGKKNFRQAKDAEKCFYGFDNMQGKNEALIITEGEIDTLSFMESGFTDVVSIPDGAPSSESVNYKTKFDFLKSAEDRIKKYQKIILAMDNDAPGKRAEKELSRRIGIEKCLYVKYPDGCKDANETLIKHGRGELKNIISSAIHYPIDGLFSGKDFKDRVNTLYDYGEQRGELTGWYGLDQYYSVLPGELTVITGIPSSGKSNWLDCLMINLIDSSDWKFAVYSPENWPIERHIQTLSEKITAKPFYKDYVDNSRVDKEYMNESIDYIDNKIFFIQPNETDDFSTVDRIIELSKIALFRHGISALIIDPWNEVEHDFGNMTETQYISKQLGKLRKFGRMNGIHIFIVAHPQKLIKNSSGNYSPPTMYDISGGAHWRNKADNGICVHRENKEDEKDHTQIIIQKIRFRNIGKIGMHKLRYEYSTAKYIDDLPQD